MPIFSAQVSKQGLSHPLPGFPLYDLPDCGCPYTQMSSQKSQGHTRSTLHFYPPNFVRRQFSPRTFVGIAICSYCHAAFLFSIANIVCLSSKKQMIGSHAQRIIAMVTDKHTVGNRAEVEFPRNPVGKQNLAIMKAFSDCAISVGSRPAPQPARFRFLNALPKALQEWSTALVVGVDKSVIARATPADTFSYWIAAATGAQGNGDRLRLHRKFTPFGAMPTAVHAARGPLIGV